MARHPSDSLGFRCACNFNGQGFGPFERTLLSVMHGSGLESSLIQIDMLVMNVYFAALG